ncbi:Disease resistance protein RPM1 [Dichanthelium oligosanthes]|uniref:Disease resistance protein RPM1 n=1 Tax=Dichanthelium oligosanthes TaxID=888268 RepID=A0A1E5VIN1_9POAL|nr:Disease resistance protein RPM1 [Dichanthelium oligosanthes]
MDAAVSISAGSLGVVLGKLQMLAAEYSRIKSLHTKIGSLGSELDSMHALLRKVSAMEDEGTVDVQVKAWAWEVREMAYDVEDCVDSFAHQQRYGTGVISKRHTRLFRKCDKFIQKLRAWRQFANQIDALKKRFVEVAERRERYRLDNLACGSTSSTTLFRGVQDVDPRLSALVADEGHLIGIDGPKYELVRWLLDGGESTEHPKVLSVAGFGGVGKTTLANQVYVEIGGHFDCKAFVSVSQKPHLKQILRDCLRKLCHDRQFTQDIREWDEMEIIMKAREYLADKSISGLLANRPVVKEAWEKVRNSIGSALETDRSLDGIKAILNLSYNDLPHHLKTCLLYLSLFPEDCNIERSRLVNRWIAEGFIPQERGLSLQDVAESYFYELINMNMVQPTDIGYDGKARACRIHDIMLELIISKAAEENFATIIGSQAYIAYPQGNIRRLSIQQAGQEVAPIIGVMDVSHARSLTAVGLAKYLPCLVHFKVLRVLDFEGCMDLEEYDLNNIEKLTQLMYLSLYNTKISKVPSEIVKLYDLETLDLRGTEVVELPAGIVHLTKLQHLLTAKPSTWLTANYCRGLTKVPDGIGNMISLQVLSGINISMSSVTAVEDLGKLTSLKELHIQLDAKGYDRTKRHEEVLISSLCKLGHCKLQYLWIYSSDCTPMEFLNSWTSLPCSLQRFRMTTSYYFLKIPKWIAPALTNLAYLNINLVEVGEEDLHILGGLHALISLELWFGRTVKPRLTVGQSIFQCLKEFNFVSGSSEFSGEGYVVFVEGALPNLEKLGIPFSVSVAKGNSFYLGISHLRCLKYAEVILGREGATLDESLDAAAAIRNEADHHQNHPRVTIL